MVFTIVWDMWYWKVWFDLIWFNLIRHSKSHWKQYSLQRIFILQHCRFTRNQYFSISFSFSCYRCFCSRRIHSRKVKRTGWRFSYRVFYILEKVWHPMKNRHPLKIEKSDKCHYNGLIRRYFTSLLLLTHSSRS